jgi:hypothetical protein
MDRGEWEMKKSAGIVGVAGLAFILSIAAAPVRVNGHSIVKLMDQSIARSQVDLHRNPLAAAMGDDVSGSARTKSVPKAFLFSLLVPGTGQFYTQEPGRGKLFIGTELAILTGYLSFRLYSHWKEEDYELYAATHAGVDTHGKSVDYFEDISLFMSMEEYNRQQLQDFREEAQIYTGDDFWQWDSDGSRRKFDSLYRASTNARDNSVIMTGIGLLNHLMSAVDAARSARIFNKRNASRPTDIRFTFTVKPKPGASLVMVGLKKKF